ncbi:MAG TPA: CapA family protein [Polyangia bacterium]|jgi:poly-gamma-glutamate synthesis protein (capsule biosynthesis protein)
MAPHPVTILLCGDVMTGRGVDQVLGHPSDPRLFELSIRDARGYVELAEQRSGPIPRAVDPAYVWGEALGELRRAAPAARVVNLETSVTRSDEHWPDKGINYRMHPANVGCLTAAGIDVCALANNHVLDWGHAGLLETLATLRRAGIATAGAGRSDAEAAAPAAVALPGGARLLVFALGAASSGIPPDWAATEDRPGVAFLSALSESAADDVAARLRRARRPGDLLVASLHWGDNWGYGIPEAQVRFAHRLIDLGVDTLGRISAELGSRFAVGPDGSLDLLWDGPP